MFNWVTSDYGENDEVTTGDEDGWNEDDDDLDNLSLAEDGTKNGGSEDPPEDEHDVVGDILGAGLGAGLKTGWNRFLQDLTQPEDDMDDGNEGEGGGWEDDALEEVDFVDEENDTIDGEDGNPLVQQEDSMKENGWEEDDILNDFGDPQHDLPSNPALALTPNKTTTLSDVQTADVDEVVGTEYQTGHDSMEDKEAGESGWEDEDNLLDDLDDLNGLEDNAASHSAINPGHANTQEDITNTTGSLITPGSYAASGMFSDAADEQDGRRTEQDDDVQGNHFDGWNDEGDILDDLQELGDSDTPEGNATPVAEDEKALIKTTEIQKGNRKDRDDEQIQEIDADGWGDELEDLEGLPDTQKSLHDNAVAEAIEESDLRPHETNEKDDGKQNHTDYQKEENYDDGWNEKGGILGDLGESSDASVSLNAAQPHEEENGVKDHHDQIQGYGDEEGDTLGDLEGLPDTVSLNATAVAEEAANKTAPIDNLPQNNAKSDETVLTQGLSKIDADADTQKAICKAQSPSYLSSEILTTVSGVHNESSVGVDRGLDGEFQIQENDVGSKSGWDDEGLDDLLSYTQTNNDRSAENDDQTQEKDGWEEEDDMLEDLEGLLDTSTSARGAQGLGRTGNALVPPAEPITPNVSAKNKQNSVDFITDPSRGTETSTSPNIPIQVSLGSHHHEQDLPPVVDHTPIEVGEDVVVRRDYTASVSVLIGSVQSTESVDEDASSCDKSSKYLPVVDHTPHIGQSLPSKQDDQDGGSRDDHGSLLGGSTIATAGMCASTVAGNVSNYFSADSVMAESTFWAEEEDVIQDLDESQAVARSQTTVVEQQRQEETNRVGFLLEPTIVDHAPPDLVDYKRNFRDTSASLSVVVHSDDSSSSQDVGSDDEDKMKFGPVVDHTPAYEESAENTRADDLLVTEGSMAVEAWGLEDDILLDEDMDETAYGTSTAGCCGGSTIADDVDEDADTIDHDTDADTYKIEHDGNGREMGRGDDAAVVEPRQVCKDYEKQKIVSDNLRSTSDFYQKEAASNEAENAIDEDSLSDRKPNLPIRQSSLVPNTMKELEQQCLGEDFHKTESDIDELGSACWEEDDPALDDLDLSGEKKTDIEADGKEDREQDFSSENTDNFNSAIAARFIRGEEVEIDCKEEVCSGESFPDQTPTLPARKSSCCIAASKNSNQSTTIASRIITDVREEIENKDDITDEAEGDGWDDDNVALEGIGTKEIDSGESEVLKSHPPPPMPREQIPPQPSSPRLAQNGEPVPSSLNDSKSQTLIPSAQGKKFQLRRPPQLSAPQKQPQSQPPPPPPPPQRQQKPQPLPPLLPPPPPQQQQLGAQEAGMKTETTTATTKTKVLQNGTQSSSPLPSSTLPSSSPSPRNDELVSDVEKEQTVVDHTPQTTDGANKHRSASVAASEAVLVPSEDSSCNSSCERDDNDTYDGHLEYGPVVDQTPSVSSMHYSRLSSSLAPGAMDLEDDIKQDEEMDETAFGGSTLNDETAFGGSTTQSQSSSDEDQLVDRIPHGPGSRFGDASTLVVADPSEVLSHVDDLVQEEGNYGPVVDQTPPSRPTAVPSATGSTVGAGSTVVVASVAGVPDDLDDADDTVNAAEEDTWDHDPPGIQETPNPQSGNDEGTNQSVLREQVVDFLPPQNDMPDDQNRADRGDGWSEVATGGLSLLPTDDPKEDEFGPVVDHTPVPPPSTPFSAVSTASQVASSECEALRGDDGTEVGTEASKEDSDALVVDPLPRTRELENVDSTATLAQSQFSEDEEDDDKYGPVVDHLPTPRSAFPPSRGGSTVDALATVSEVDDDEDLIDDEDGDGWGDDDDLDMVMSDGAMQGSSVVVAACGETTVDSESEPIRDGPDQSPTSDSDRNIVSVRFQSEVDAIEETPVTTGPLHTPATLTGGRASSPKENVDETPYFDPVSERLSEMSTPYFDASMCEPDAFNDRTNDKRLLFARERVNSDGSLAHKDEQSTLSTQFAEADTPPATPYARSDPSVHGRSERVMMEKITSSNLRLPDVTAFTSSNEADGCRKIALNKLLKNEITKRQLLEEEVKVLRSELESLTSSESADVVRMEALLKMQSLKKKLEEKNLSLTEECTALRHDKKGFQSALNAAQIELSSWEARRDQWNSREVELTKLEEQSRQRLNEMVAERAKDLESMKEKLTSEIEKARWSESQLKQELEEFKAKGETLKAEVDQLNCDLVLVQRALGERDLERTEWKAKESALENEINHLRGSLDELNNVKLSSESELSGQVTSLQSELTSKSSSCEELNVQVDLLKQRLSTTEGQSLQRTKEHMELSRTYEQEMASLQEEVAASRSQLEDFRRLQQQESNEAKTIMTESDAKIANISAERDNLQQTVEDLMRSLEQLQRESQNSLQAKDTEMQALESKSNGLESHNAKLAMELCEAQMLAKKSESLSYDLHSITAEREELKVELSDKKEEIAKLQVQSESLASDLRLVTKERETLEVALTEDKETLANVEKRSSDRIMEMESSLADKDNDIASVERERNDLRERQAEHMQEVDMLRSELEAREKEKNLFLREIEDLNSKCRSFESVAESAKLIATKEEAKFTKCKMELESLRSEMSIQITKVENISRAEHESLSQNKEIENELSRARERVQMLTKKSESLSDNLNSIKTEREGLKVELRDKKLEIAKLQMRSESLASDLRLVTKERETLEMALTEDKETLVNVKNRSSDRVMEMESILADKDKDIASVERERNDLRERQAEHMQKVDMLRSELEAREGEKNIFLLEIEDLSSKCRSFESVAESAKLIAVKEEAKFKKCKMELESLRSEMSIQATKVEDNSRAEHELLLRNKEIESEMLRVREEAASNRSKVDELQSLLSKASMDVRRLEEANLSALSDKDKLAVKCREMEENLSTSMKVFSGRFKDESERHAVEMTSLKEKCIRLESTARERASLSNDQQQKIQALEVEVSVEKQSAIKKDDAIKQLEKKLEDIHTQFQKLREENKILPQQIKELESTVAGLEEERDQYASNVGHNMNEVGELRRVLDALKDELEILRQETSDQKCIVTAKDAELAQQNEQVEQSRAHIQKLLHDNCIMSERIGELEEALNSVENERNKLASEIDMHKKNQEQLQVSFESLKNKQEVTTRKNHEDKSQNEKKLNNLLRELRLTVSNLEQQRDHLAREVENKTKSERELGHNLDKLTSEHEAVLRDQSRLTEENEDMLVQFGLLKIQIDAYENQVETLQEQVHQFQHAAQLAERQLLSTQKRLTDAACGTDADNMKSSPSVRLDMENMIEDLNVENSKLLRKTNDLSATIAARDKLIEKLSEEKKERQACMEERDAALREKDARMQTLLEQLQNEGGQNEIKSLRTRINHMEETAARASARIRELQGMHALAQDELNANREKLSAAEGSMLDLEMELHSKKSDTSKSKDLEQRVRELEVELMSKAKEAAKSSQECESLRSRLSSVHSMVEVEQQRNSSLLEDSRSSMSAEIRSLQGELELVRKKLSSESSRHSARENYIEKEIDELQVLLSKRDEHIRVMERQVQSREDDLVISQQELASKEQAFDRLTTEIEQMRSQQKLSAETAYTQLLKSTQEDAENIDSLRSSIVALAQALERSESRRADAIERLMMERDTHVDSLRRLSDSVKRFYSTLSTGES